MGYEDRKRKLESLNERKKKVLPSESKNKPIDLNDPENYGSDGELKPCFKSSSDFIVEDDDGPKGYLTDDNEESEDSESEGEDEDNCSSTSDIDVSRVIQPKKKPRVTKTSSRKSNPLSKRSISMDKFTPVTIEITDDNQQPDRSYFRQAQSKELSGVVVPNTPSPSSKEKTPKNKSPTISESWKLYVSIEGTRFLIPSPTSKKLQWLQDEASRRYYQDAHETVEITKLVTENNIILSRDDLIGNALQPNQTVKAVVKQRKSTTLWQAYQQQCQIANVPENPHVKRQLTYQDSSDLIQLPIYLRLEGCLSDEEAEPLFHAMKLFPSITSIDLSNNGLGDNSLKLLSDSLKLFDKLAEVNISSNQFTGNSLVRFLQSLEGSSETLTSLNLSFNIIPERSTKAVTRLLEKCKNLRHLDLRSCQMGSKAILALHSGLKNLMNLESLYLSRNEELFINSKIILDGNPFHIKPFQKLLDSIKSHSKLEILECNQCGLQGEKEEKLEQLSQKLYDGLKLKELYLSDNNLGQLGVSKLAQGISVKTYLVKLYLEACNLEFQACRVLSYVLRKNTTVKVLSLRSNPDIRDDGVIEISSLFKNNRTLEEIYLAGCTVGLRGSVSIIKALQDPEDRSPLICLDLSNNLDILIEESQKSGENSLTGALLQKKTNLNILILTKGPQLDNWKHSALQAAWDLYHSPSDDGTTLVLEDTKLTLKGTVVSFDAESFL